MSNSSKLSIKEKLAYGLGDTGSNIVFQVVIIYMMFFYTDVFGISAAAAGTLMLVRRSNCFWLVAFLQIKSCMVFKKRR